MPNAYHPFVQAFAALLEQGRDLPLGGFAPLPAPPLEPQAPLALFLSPHPDDETIGGALSLRLQRELGHRVAVVAVTQGSNPSRRAARREEFRGACGFLGFEPITLGEAGLEAVTPAARAQDPGGWAPKVELLAGILRQRRPRILILPHAGDGHPTHQGTHHLGMDALRSLGTACPCRILETEFWAPLPDPDLLMGVSPALVADLMAGLSFHREEVRRNPYHLLLPSWMSDNVRRGAELVGGQGGSVPDCAFANLFRLSEWTGSTCIRPLRSGIYVPPEGGLGALLGA